MGLDLGLDFGRIRGSIFDPDGGGGCNNIDGFLSGCIGNFFGNGVELELLAIAIFSLRRYLRRARAIVICSCSSLVSGSFEELAVCLATVGFL